MQNSKNIHVDGTTEKNRCNLRSSLCDIKSKDLDFFAVRFFDPYFLKYIGSHLYLVTVHDMIPEQYNRPMA